MSPIERYALSTGVKIENPQILEHFYPVSADKYVCFGPSKKDNLRDYDFWNLVIELISPVLKGMGYTTVQIGTQKDDPIGCDIDLRGKLNIRQAAGVLKNCEFFVGVDTFLTHIAAFQGKPIVAIYAASFLECCKPHWGDFSKHHLIQTPRGEKENPSFILNENPKSINRIKPEEIVSKIVKILGVNFDPRFRTLYVGPRFKDECVDVIPFSFSKVVSDKINIRMDIFHGEKELQQILQNNRAEVTIRTSFELNFQNVRNIKSVNYVSDSFDTQFIERLKKLGIKITLLCTSEDALSRERFKLFDYTINLFQPDKLIEENKKKLTKDPFLVSTISSKKVICGDKAFNSLFEYSKKVDDFFVDLDWLYVYDRGHE